MKIRRNLVYVGLASLGLICFALLSPKAFGVSPPPDGGYPGGNTAEGQNALLSLTTGGYNTAVGFSSLSSDTTGSFNTAAGAGALFLGSGDQNTATGAAALLSNASGGGNTANGAFALLSNTTGDQNTAVGFHALYSNSTGHHNTAVGPSAGFALSSGSYNILLGFAAGGFVQEAFNVIAIGTAGHDVNNSCYIGNIWGETVDPKTGSSVFVDDDGKLGTVSSSRRFKRDIQPMDKASEAILALKPVTFHYKRDDKSTPCFGLIAEEVAEVSPDLVLRDQNGEIYTVRYDAVNAMLLNEFLKEHRTVQEQGQELQKQAATIAKQKKQLEALSAGLQKVSAQIDTSRAARKVVLNP